MRDPNQKMRFSDTELAIVKRLFADNDNLLFAIRKLLLQFPLTTSEAEAIRAGLNKDTLKIVKKFILPDLDQEAPLFQMADLYLGLGSELKEGVERAWPYIKAKDLEVDYIAQQMSILENIVNGKPSHSGEITLEALTDKGKEPSTKVALDKYKEDRWINLTARNFILSFIDSNVQQIKFLAGLPEESVEETKKRLAQNSNK